MAHDKTYIAKVRATYESNNLSFVKIWELFPDIPSHKTIESWASADKKRGNPWVKNRYSSTEEAIETIVKEDIETLQTKAEEALTKQLKGVVPTELIDDSAYMAELGKQSVKRALTKNSLMEMMEENLQDSFIIAKKSPHINTKATFQMMAKSVMEAKYGKNINLGLSDANDIIDENEIRGKTQQELLEMLDNIKEE